MRGKWNDLHLVPRGNANLVLSEAWNAKVITLSVAAN